ncbi:endonuclease domain-containing protein [Modestobacter marinus]|uniref:endonuclease domain-containing protein n=1 Tax=Modestobacter marinus TaxID=477641 RepID=UPI001C96376F|nr:endonuclease domain-containing protein [Modestobacter marinus]
MRRHLTGVFIGSHAIAEGLLTAKQLRQRSYRRLVQGVYADPGLDVDHRLRCAGVALVLPPGTAIGGHSAAAWHGAPFAGPQDPVTVLRPPSVLWKGPRGVRVHRAELAADDIEQRDGVPVTSALRTAWDVAGLEPLGTAVAALDAMVRSGAATLTDLAARVENGAGRWGVVRVRRAVQLIDARAESPPESRVRVALVVAGLAPVPQFEVWSAGVLLGRADLAFPEEMVLVEYEGAYHFDGPQIVRDDDRIARLQAAGWRVIRLSAADLRDLYGVVVRVRAALAR